MMQELIARLIRCAMPRETAVFLSRYFLHHGGQEAFEKYVNEVEEECRVKLDAI